MLNSVPSLTITTRFNVVTSKGECVEIGEELTQYRRFYEDAVVATDFIPLQSDVLKSLLSDHCALEAAIRKAGEQGNIPLETHKDTPFSVHVDAARNLELLMKVVASVKKSEIQPASKEAVVSASREMPEFYRYLAPEFFTSVRVEASTRNEKTSYDWEKIGSVHSEVLSTRGSQKKHGLAECLDILNFYSHCACQLIIEKGASECMLHKVTFPLSDNEKIFKMSAALEAIFLKSGSDLWSQPDESKLTSPEHLIIRELEIQFYSKLFFSESSMCFRKLSPLVCFVRMTGEMVAAFDKNCIKISFTHPCRDFINLYHQRLLQYCCGVSGDVDCSQWPEKLSDSLLAKVSNRYAIIDLSERTATASIVECVLHSVGKDKVLLVPAYYINESGKQVVIHCFGSGRVFDLSTCREGRICDADLTVPKVLPGAPCTVALSSSGKKLIATLYSHPFRACEPTGEEAVDNNKYDFTIPIEERNTKERNEELFR